MWILEGKRGPDHATIARRKIGADNATVQGIAQENFVFLELRRRVERLNYAMEVKSGKNQATTGQKAFKKKVYMTERIDF